MGARSRELASCTVTVIAVEVRIVQFIWGDCGKWHWVCNVIDQLEWLTNDVQFY